MTEPLIYRIETCNGAGLYTSNILPSDNPYFPMSFDAINPKIHPSPCMDQELNFRNLENKFDYKFGFASLQQYFNWTISDSARLYLREKSFVLSCYTSNIMHSSKYQCIFITEKSEKITTTILPLSSNTPS